MLEFKQVETHYDNNFSLKSINLSLQAGQWLMIAGPNGAGKSTLVKAIAGSIDYEGSIFYRGKNISSMTSKEKARAIGVLHQRYDISFDFTVEEIVNLGRYAYQSSPFSNLSSEDKIIIEEMLHRTGLQHLRNKSAQAISGGELQRTFLAQLLVQNPNVLVLDEPANHLDLVYQKEIFQLIQNWLNEGERAVISVVHDLTTAKFYGNQGLLMNQGKVIAQGDIQKVMTPDHLQQAYHMNVFEWMHERSKVWKLNQ